MTSCVTAYLIGSVIRNFSEAGSCWWSRFPKYAPPGRLWKRLTYGCFEWANRSRSLASALALCRPWTWCRRGVGKEFRSIREGSRYNSSSAQSVFCLGPSHGSGCQRNSARWQAILSCRRRSTGLFKWLERLCVPATASGGSSTKTLFTRTMSRVTNCPTAWWGRAKARAMTEWANSILAEPVAEECIVADVLHPGSQAESACKCVGSG